LFHRVFLIHTVFEEPSLLSVKITFLLLIVAGDSAIDRYGERLRTFLNDSADPSLYI
jgi:hypothetical protein